MSECLRYTDGWRVLDESLQRQRQRAFEVAGGEGPVGDFMKRGSEQREWEAMSDDEQSLWLTVAGIVLPVLSMKEVVRIGTREPVRLPSWEELVRSVRRPATS